MLIAIRKELNGTIYIDKNLRSEIDYTQPPYNFNLIEIDNVYNDCESEDFNEDLTFNVNKYNTRKQKENASVRINELKTLLEKTDYQAIKFAEGEISAVQYEPMRLQRKFWREEINNLGG